MSNNKSKMYQLIVGNQNKLIETMANFFVENRINVSDNQVVKAVQLQNFGADIIPNLEDTVNKYNELQELKEGMFQEQAEMLGDFTPEHLFLITRTSNGKVRVEVFNNRQEYISWLQDKTSTHKAFVKHVNKVYGVDNEDVCKFYLKDEKEQIDEYFHWFTLDKQWFCGNYVQAISQLLIGGEELTTVDNFHKLVRKSNV